MSFENDLEEQNRQILKCADLPFDLVESIDCSNSPLVRALMDFVTDRNAYSRDLTAIIVGLKERLEQQHFAHLEQIGRLEMECEARLSTKDRLLVEQEQRYAELMEKWSLETQEVSDLKQRKELDLNNFDQETKSKIRLLEEELSKRVSRCDQLEQEVGEMTGERDEFTKNQADMERKIVTLTMEKSALIGQVIAAEHRSSKMQETMRDLNRKVEELESRDFYHRRSHHHDVSRSRSPSTSADRLCRRVNSENCTRHFDENGSKKFPSPP